MESSQRKNWNRLVFRKFVPVPNKCSLSILGVGQGMKTDIDIGILYIKFNGMGAKNIDTKLWIMHWKCIIYVEERGNIGPD